MEEAHRDSRRESHAGPDDPGCRPIQPDEHRERDRRAARVGCCQEERDPRRARGPFVASTQPKPESGKDPRRDQRHRPDRQLRVSGRSGRTGHERTPGGKQERATEIGEDLGDRDARTEHRGGCRTSLRGRIVVVRVPVRGPSRADVCRAQSIGGPTVDEARCLPGCDVRTCVTHVDSTSLRHPKDEHRPKSLHDSPGRST